MPKSNLFPPHCKSSILSYIWCCVVCGAKFTKMAKRHKKQPQQKRQQITDESGWTHVTRGPKKAIDSQHLTPLRPEKIPPGLTLDKFSEKFQKNYSGHWQASSCCKDLCRIFEQQILPLEYIIITNCVCLGLGSMTTGLDSSSYEMAALIFMLEILGKVTYITQESKKHLLPPSQS